MAKKGNRIEFSISCAACKRTNYRTEKNRINDPEKLMLKKFCATCRQITEHKEVKN